MSNNSGKSLAEYSKFMAKYAVFGKDAPHTHTIVGRPGGKYNIPQDKYDEFLEVYTKGYKPGGYHLVEKPADMGPLLIDLDFRQDVEHRQYTKDDIKHVVKYSTDIIRKYYKITTKGEIRAFVCEKRVPSKHNDGGYKDGFHIVYPGVPISTNMRFLLLIEIRNLLYADGAFSHIEYKNDFVKEVFDLSVVKSNGWMIYGSNKQGGKPYEVTCIYDNKMNEIDKKKFSFADLVKILSNRKFESCEEHPLNEKINISDLNKKLARVQQEVRTKKEILPKAKLGKVKMPVDNGCDADADNDADDDNNDGSVSEEEEVMAPKPKSKSKTDKFRDIKTRKFNDVELAVKLSELLSDKRATSFQEWTQVGWALYNTSSKLMKAWKTFSKRTTKNNYDEAYCERFWNDPKKKENQLTIGSLHVWAKADSPEKYGALMRDNISEMLLDAETGTEYDIAKVMFELYGHRFRCSDIDRNMWYEFQGSLWVNIQGGYTLHNLISEELIKEYMYLQMSILSDMINKKGTEYDGASKRNENIQKIITKLKRPAFKDGIVIECKRKFYDKKFEERLDSNIYLIGFNNGVYDLETAHFRKGLPDDFVSFTVGYDYPDNYTVDHPDVKWVEQFLSLVQTDKDMNEYLKILLASYIDGSTANENFVIWTGKGANGKSKTMEFFTKAFGDYCSTLPVTLLTGNRPPAGGATPELAQMRGKRFVYFEEPEKTDNIKVGYMKELSGGSEITARQLYGLSFKYKPQFKMLLACNRLPVIDATDGGTWRRLRVSPFSSHFVKVDNPEAKNGKFTHKGVPLKKNQFPRDDRLSENMNYYRKAFAWLIINVYYPLYKKKGLVEPPLVLEYTNKYQKDNDLMRDFLTSVYEITKDEDDYVQIVDVYGMYKSWIKENGNGSKIGLKGDITKYIEEADWGLKITSRNIYGIKEKDLAEEEHIPANKSKEKEKEKPKTSGGNGKKLDEILVDPLDR